MHTDFAPETGARLGRLLPRLASDHDGEVVATVRAIRRTLDSAGLDLHDLAERLTQAPYDAPAHGDPHRAGASDLRAMVHRLRAFALHRLTPRQADFIETAARLLETGRALTPKQTDWLRDLHDRYAPNGNYRHD